jgi:hypothetical protein
VQDPSVMAAEKEKAGTELIVDAPAMCSSVRHQGHAGAADRVRRDC